MSKAAEGFSHEKIATQTLTKQLGWVWRNLNPNKPAVLKDGAVGFDLGFTDRRGGGKDMVIQVIRRGATPAELQALATQAGDAIIAAYLQQRQWRRWQFGAAVSIIRFPGLGMHGQTTPGV